MHNRHIRYVQQSRLDDLAREHGELYNRFDDLRLLAITLTIPTVYGLTGLGYAVSDGSPAGIAGGIGAALVLSYGLGKGMCAEVKERMIDVRKQMRECQQEMNLLRRLDV